MVSNWNTGVFEPGTDGWEPADQLEMLKQGIPYFLGFVIHDNDDTPEANSYYQGPMEYLAARQLPFALVTTQPEDQLVLDATFGGVTDSTRTCADPTLAGAAGSCDSRDDLVSPFGPASNWTTVGEEWGNQTLLNSTLPGYYASPPFVIWLSNNEPERVVHTNIGADDRAPASGTDDEDAEELASRWPALYDAMWAGIRSQASWGSLIRFHGYRAVDGQFTCRFSTWQDNTRDFITSPLEPDWGDETFDGGTSSSYECTTCGRDDEVISPQLGAMDAVERRADALSDAPSFWYDTSVWEGDAASKARYTGDGQTVDAVRRKGNIRYILWIEQPRILWNFNNNNEARSTMFDDFLPAMEAVSEVHETPDLARFWRTGTLVKNTSQSHPYQVSCPGSYPAANQRWYALATNESPAPDLSSPPGTGDDMLIKALAHEIGTTPNREWLLYAHAPVAEETGVTVTIPGFGDATGLTVPREGAFWLCPEGGSCSQVTTRNRNASWN